MAVYYIHDYGYAGLVCGVYQRLKLLGGAEAARRREEVAHMVAERPIVRMLLYRHYLYGVVAVGGDARQHVLAELVVRAHTLALLRHAYVAFVYQQRLRVGTESVNGPAVRFLRLPHLR